MIQAFRENKDIHRTTASTIFNIPLEEVTDIYRRYAKAVNFGIIYGISDFGLSENVGITVKEAEKYPKIKEYMDNTKNIAVEKGYVETKFGRRRYVPNIKSQNYIIREQAKRIAMNAPIQGTAADITKIAMVKIEERIKKEKLDAKILLQVHDEIIVECNNNIQDKGQKSMPLGYIREYGYEIKAGAFPQIPYLNVIKEHLLGGKTR